MSDALYDTFQAASIAPGLYEGVYKDPDTDLPVHDESRRYIVAIELEQLGSLRGLLAEACEAFAQKCIYLSVAGQVEFISARQNHA